MCEVKTDEVKAENHIHCGGWVEMRSNNSGIFHILATRGFVHIHFFFFIPYLGILCGAHYGSGYEVGRPVILIWAGMG